uniref:Uncharacterized protein n=1 Tax=Anguilla anguilla TaxID=7936 RepID=A0A0E9SLG6_ANGAN
MNKIIVLTCCLVYSSVIKVKDPNLSGLLVDHKLYSQYR